MKFIQQANKLYEEFGSKKDIEKYSMPFPIAVFGTLRKLPGGHYNTKLMYTKEPSAHCKAFLPHFVPVGIWLNFEQDAAGTFEIYFYKPEDFEEVIKEVDRLEGFSPQNNPHGYIRTLMKVRILPDDYQHKTFDEHINYGGRNLQIPPEEWDAYPSVPAWVYSNVTANEKHYSNLQELGSVLYW